MAKQLVASQYRQDKLYIEVLEADNQKLMKGLAEAAGELKLLEHGTINSAVEDTLDKNKKYRFQLKLAGENL